MIAPAIVALLKKIPLITRTGPVIRNLDIYDKPTNRLFVFVLNYLVNFNYRRSKYIVVVTDTISAYVLKNYKISPEKVRVFKNGYNPEIFYFSPSTKPDNKTEGKTIFFAGSFFKDVGIEDLLIAVQQIALSSNETGSCILAGNGPLFNELRLKYQGNTNGWNVSFLGPLAQQRINSLLAEAHIGVVPFGSKALLETGSSAVKIMEYLGTGTPVLATRHPDHFFIEKLRLGILCQPDNPNDMAHKLRQLLSNEASYDKMKLQKFALKHGTWEVAYQRIKNLCALAHKQ